MDLDGHYCPLRRDMEQHGWNLANRLAAITSRLLNLIGQDHQEFLQVKAECGEISQQLAELRQQLQDHRREHGC